MCLERGGVAGSRQLEAEWHGSPSLIPRTMSFKSCNIVPRERPQSAKLVAEHTRMTSSTGTEQVEEHVRVTDRYARPHEVAFIDPWFPVTDAGPLLAAGSDMHAVVRNLPLSIISIPQHLRDVGVPPVILPLHVILLNEPINIPLNVRHTKYTPTDGSFDHFAHQLSMADSLATLHDAHDGCLRLEIPVFCDANMSLLVLLLSLTQLDLIDLDAVFWMLE
jgi:hypothetical protein